MPWKINTLRLAFDLLDKLGSDCKFNLGEDMVLHCAARIALKDIKCKELRGSYSYNYYPDSITHKKKTSKYFKELRKANDMCRRILQCESSDLKYNFKGGEIMEDPKSEKCSFNWVYTQTAYQIRQITFKEYNALAEAHPVIELSYIGDLIPINRDLGLKYAVSKFLGFEPYDYSKDQYWDEKSRYGWIFQDKESGSAAEVYVMFDSELHCSGDSSLLKKIFERSDTFKYMPDYHR